jgi:hypothetical protein
MNITPNTRKALASEWLLDALLSKAPQPVIDFLIEKSGRGLSKSVITGIQKTESLLETKFDSVPNVPKPIIRPYTRGAILKRLMELGRVGSFATFAVPTGVVNTRLFIKQVRRAAQAARKKNAKDGFKTAYSVFFSPHDCMVRVKMKFLVRENNTALSSPPWGTGR